MLLPLQQNNMQFKLMVQAGDLQHYLSGGAGNHDPAASLGGVISSYDIIPDGVRGNLLDAVTAAEASSGLTTYLCYYLKNTSTTETWVSGEVWIEMDVASTTLIAIGLDPVGVGDGVSTGVAVVIANDTSVPAGVVFTSPSASPGLSIGNLDAGEVHAIWIRRTVLVSTSAAPDDRFTLRHSGSDY